MTKEEFLNDKTLPDLSNGSVTSYRIFPIHITTIEKRKIGDAVLFMKHVKNTTGIKVTGKILKKN